MFLTNNDLSTIVEGAIKAATCASDYIASEIVHTHIVDTKLGQGEVGTSLASQVVTEVDLRSQEIILDNILYLTEKYDLGLLTEELVDDNSRFEKDYFWCIDPLDGTLPFIEKQSGFSVSIALVSQYGEAVIGVVCDPLNKNIYHAVKGVGAFKNGEMFKHNQLAASLTFVTDRSFTEYVGFDGCLNALKAYAAANELDKVELISHGGAAMNACWMLDKIPACYFKFPKEAPGGGSIWDYAASSVIAKEAGAVVSDIFGNRLQLNNSETTFMNRGGILYASDERLALLIRDLYKKKTP